jgi:4-hydroxy-tetrahydrodipicolinate synthase
MTMLFQGLSAFPITPADDEGHVDAAGMRRLVRRLASSGVDSIGLLGSTGAAPYLTRPERRRATEAALSEAGDAIPIMVGIGALRTSDALHLARDAAAVGAAALLLAPISYLPLTEDEVFRHAATIAEATSLPLCLYDNPTTTRFTFSPALIGRLSRVANIVSAKTPAPPIAAMPAVLAEYRAHVPPGFSIGASGDALAAEALLAGYDAWYSVLAGTLPELCVPIAAAARAGDAATARARHAALAPLWDLFTEYTSIRVVHAMVTQLGLCDAAPPRPLLPLGAAAAARIAAAVARCQERIGGDVPSPPNPPSIIGPRSNE